MISRFGNLQLRRGRSQIVQAHLNLEHIRKLKILIPLPQFREYIAKIVKEAHAKRKTADELYKRGEKLLLQEFGVDRLELAKDKPSEIRYSEVNKSKRLDAEYYKPEYKEIVEILERSKFDLRLLKNAVNISKKTTDPTQKPDKTFAYIELANVNPSSGEIEVFLTKSGSLLY